MKCDTSCTANRCPKRCAKIYRDGVARSGYFYTEAEKQFIKKYYPIMRTSELAKRLGRTPKNIAEYARSFLNVYKIISHQGEHMCSGTSYKKALSAERWSDAEFFLRAVNSVPITADRAHIDMGLLRNALAARRVELQ